MNKSFLVFIVNCIYLAMSLLEYKIEKGRIEKSQPADNTCDVIHCSMFTQG